MVEISFCAVMPSMDSIIHTVVSNLFIVVVCFVSWQGIAKIVQETHNILLSRVCLQNKGIPPNAVSSDVSKTRLSGNIHVLLEIKQAVNLMEI